MSWSERIVRDHKRQTDCAIHRAYSLLVSDPSTLEIFEKLLYCVRKRAVRLLEAPVLNGRHLGVDALVHLSRFHKAHIRSVTDWTGTASSWRSAVSSLAHHLICEYKVPMFLVSSWYASDLDADRKRGWLVAHSRGISFRSLELPISMTRKMEHIFLSSSDHLPIEHAMRKAELLALGAPNEVVKEVMATHLATDLSNGDFWRTVWLFLIANADSLKASQIGPLIDYIQAVLRIQTTAERPQALFSMKGRTVQSMLRLMQDWHRSLGKGGVSFSWMRSPFEEFILEDPECNDSDVQKRWQMMELTDSAQLRSEGALLHHCVASYADRCYYGRSSIWSLRLWKGEKVHPVLTVEVDPKKRCIVQARGRANRMAHGKPLRILQDWAGREKLRLVI